MLRVVLAIVVALVVAACTPQPGPPTGSPTPSPTGPPSPGGSTSSPPPSPTGAPSPTPSPKPSETPRPLGTLSITPDGKLNVEADMEQTAHDDGSLQLSLTLDDVKGPTRLELRMGQGIDGLVSYGGLATLLSDDDKTLAVVPRPNVRDAEDQPVPTEMISDEEEEDLLTFLVTPEERHSGKVLVDVWIGRQVIAHVTTGEEGGAPRYSVIRTAFGQAVLGGGLATPGAREFFEDTGWQQALTIEPALTAPESLKQQFDCHVLGAPNKEAWNLEAFRPANPDWMLGALQHRCNWDEDDLVQGEDEPESPEPSDESS